MRSDLNKSWPEMNGQTSCSLSRPSMNNDVEIWRLDIANIKMLRNHEQWLWNFRRRISELCQASYEQHCLVTILLIEVTNSLSGLT